MKKYRVLVVGMGKRGKHHAKYFYANDNFEVAGICDIDKTKLIEIASSLGNPRTGTNALNMAKELSNQNLSLFEQIRQTDD